MEENKNAVTQTEDKKEVTAAQAEQKEQKEKTFTQAQVDDIVKERIKKFPSKEELDEFNKWKESQKSDEEKQKEKDDKTKRELQEGTDAKRELQVLKAGVSQKFSAFVAYEVAKQEGDFKTNLAEYLKENPDFLQSSETKIVKRTSASMNGKVQTSEKETNRIMNDIIRNARK